MLTRRRLLQLASGASVATLAAPMINFGHFRLFAGSSATYSARAIVLLGRSLVIDMLSPLTLNLERMPKLLTHPEGFTAAEVQPYRDSSISVFHCSIGVGGRQAYVDVLKYLAGWNGFIAHHARDFLRISSAADLEGVKSSGKIGLLLGLQNSEHFQQLDDVDFFHGIGQRVSQLTYNARNLIGNGSTERRDDGLSDFGVSVVERMNKVGMAVDVSHCGDRTTLDAFDVSKKPVLITHSNCRALNPNHPRCKTDEAIRKMAVNSGVMGVTSVRMFVRDTEPTTLEHMLDHYDHVARLVGVEHLGVGSDIDLYGYDALPPEQIKRLQANYKSSYGFREKSDIEGVDHPKRMFDLTEGLIRRGYSDAHIELILGGNFKRVLAQIWTV